jgi:hypothetical protein
MAMNLLKALFPSNVIILFGLLLFTAKAFITLLICSASLLFLNTLHIWTIWIVVSIITDAQIFFFRPKFIFDLNLTERQETRFRIKTEEMKKYLLLTPLIRFIRTIFFSAGVFAISSISDLETNLFISLMIGFIVIDPIINKIFNIKSPTIFKSTPGDLPSSTELHRNNLSLPGTGAWNALESNRLIK